MSLKPLRGRILAVMGALGLTGACDNPWRIDRLDALVGDVRSHLIPMAAGGLPTAVRGAPFADWDAAQTLARLEMPNGLPADLRFRMAGPDDGGRLILVFNPDGPPDGYALCRGAGPTPGARGDGDGFVVLASLCNGQRLVVTARLSAQDASPDDPDGFTALMRQLFLAMFKRT